MNVYSNYWPYHGSSLGRSWEYEHASRSHQSAEDSYSSSSRASRARSASPMPDRLDRSNRSISVIRTGFEPCCSIERPSRALSVPTETHCHPREHHFSSSSKQSTYQILSSHDVVSKPYYRSFYYIKPRPDTPLYTPRAYSTARDTSVSRTYSIARDSVPREVSATYHHEPRSQLNRESSYGGRYFTKQSSPFSSKYYHYGRYPFVSSSLFLPRYYTGTLIVPHIYASSRLHM